MCKFELEYYTGDRDMRSVGVVFAENIDEAVEKVKKADRKYSGVVSVRFKEIPGWRPDFKVEK